MKKMYIIGPDGAYPVLTARERAASRRSWQMPAGRGSIPRVLRESGAHIYLPAAGHQPAGGTALELLEQAYRASIALWAN